MSERVERRLVEILDDPVESPYGNPIPGLEELGVDTGAHPALLARKTLREIAENHDAAQGPSSWKVQRLAESIQVEPEVLEQLLDVGLRPGVGVEVTGLAEAYALLTVHDEEEGDLEVELPLEVAQHIFVNQA